MFLACRTVVTMMKLLYDYEPYYHYQQRWYGKREMLSNKHFFKIPCRTGVLLRVVWPGTKLIVMCLVILVALPEACFLIYFFASHNISIGDLMVVASCVDCSV